MGCKADGAAQGYTVLGGIVLAYFAIQMIIGGLNTFSGGDINGLVVLIQGIALVLMVVLSFGASGFVSWKVGKSGALLALFGFLSIIIVVGNLTFDVIGWLTNIGTLAGFMNLLAGLLMMFSK